MARCPSPGGFSRQTCPRFLQLCQPSLHWKGRGYVCETQKWALSCSQPYLVQAWVSVQLTFVKWICCAPLSHILWLSFTGEPVPNSPAWLALTCLSCPVNLLLLPPGPLPPATLTLSAQSTWFQISKLFKKYIYIYLIALDLSCIIWDL